MFKCMKKICCSRFRQIYSIIEIKKWIIDKIAKGCDGLKWSTSGNKKKKVIINGPKGTYIWYIEAQS